MISKKLLYTLAFCLLSLSAITQQSGKVLEDRTIQSSILKRNVRYNIYLPPDYESSQRSYPVVYLLHGYTDNNNAWVQFGQIDHYANQAIQEGTIPPMIIVMPNGDSSWYINSYDGKENFEDFFVKEFMPAIEKTYHIRAEKRYRGIAGLSMGGYGTLIFALKYPELFSAAAPLSAAVLPDEELVKQSDITWDNTFGQLYGRGLKGKDRLTDAWYKYSVLKLVESGTREELSKVRYWIDCGDDDFLTKGNCLLHLALTDKKVPHEFRVRDGAHNWTYWRTGIINALQFIGQSFTQ